MFEDSLLEARFANERRRSWATATAFLFEVVLIGTLVLIPLWFTEALPARALVTFLVAPAPPPPPPPPAASPAIHPTPKPIVTELTDAGGLRTPTRIPQRVQIIKEDLTPVSSIGGVVGGVPGGIPGGELGGVIGGIVRSTPATKIARLAPPKPVQPKRVRISQGVTEGMLIHKVMPLYPSVARSARIQGAVVMNAVIGRDGTIQNLHLTSGHPFLAAAALRAVSKWQYKPYELNGQPVEVETQITVNFTLAG